MERQRHRRRMTEDDTRYGEANRAASVSEEKKQRQESDL
jgi:hypothetical protein